MFTPGRILQSLNVFGIGLNIVNTVLRVSEYLVLPVRECDITSRLSKLTL